MIDALLNYPNENAARAGSVAAAHGATPEGSFVWKASHVLQVRAWKPSEDSAVTASSNREIALDRAKCRTGARGCVKFKKNGPLSQDDFRFEPVFMGMDVPWGGLN